MEKQYKEMPAQERVAFHKEQTRKAEEAELAPLYDPMKISCSVDEMQEMAKSGDPVAIQWMLRYTLNRERSMRYHILRDSAEIPHRMKFVALHNDGETVTLKGFLSIARDVRQCFGGDDDPEGWHDQPLEFYLNIDLTTLETGKLDGIEVAAKY